MKLTIYTTDLKCTKLATVIVAHVTMLEKNTLHIVFIQAKDMYELIPVLVKHYVLFQVQGTSIKIIPEPNNLQRVGFRFNS